MSDQYSYRGLSLSELNVLYDAVNTRLRVAEQRREPSVSYQRVLEHIQVQRASLTEGWHEYQMDVCVKTRGAHKVGTLTFLVRSLSAFESMVKQYLDLHPILYLDLFNIVVRPVNGSVAEVGPFFTPAE